MKYLLTYAIGLTIFGTCALAGEGKPLQVGDKIGIPETFQARPQNWHVGHAGESTCYVYFGEGTLRVIPRLQEDLAEPQDSVLVKYHLPDGFDPNHKPGACFDGAVFSLPEERLVDYRNRWDAYVKDLNEKEEEIRGVVRGKYKGPSAVRLRDSGHVIHVGDVMNTDHLPSHGQSYELIYPETISWKANSGWASNVYTASAGQRFEPRDFEHGEFVVQGFIRKNSLVVVKYLDDASKFDDAPIGGYFLVPVNDLAGSERPSTLRKLKRSIIGGD